MATSTSLEQIRNTVQQLQSELQISSSPRRPKFQDVQAAVRANSWFLGIGIGAGLVLAGLPELVKGFIESHILLFLIGLIEHIGIGLIVAAIAVVAYEFVSEAWKAQIHSWALVNLLVLGAEDRLESAHKMLLGRNADRLEPLRDAAKYAATLLDEKNHSWATDASVEFLGELTETMKRSAQTIMEVNDYLRPSTALGKRDLKFADPSKLTDSLLKKLLLAMPPLSKYCAVSNALIWKDLTDFRDAHQQAIEKGVTIQRVFVLFQDEDAIIADADAITTIYHHYELSHQWKGKHEARYEMRFVTAKRYRKLAERLSAKKHFGVFRPASSPEKNLVFDVTEHNLSEFDVSTVGPSSPFIREFDELWRQCGETNEVRLRYVLRAERMRRMDSGSYSALSIFANWTEENLKDLHDDSMIAEVRGVTIRRIFVYTDNDTNEAMIRVLKEHTRSQRDHHDYEWVLCPMSRVPPMLTKGMPYGIFEDRGKSGGTKQVLHEVYSGNPAAPFEIGGEDAAKMLKAFDRFWLELAPDRDAILRERFGSPVAAELTV